MSVTDDSSGSGAPEPAPLWNPYLAGLMLGFTLLTSFVILGAGLGASSAPARLAACLEWCVAPQRTVNSAYFGPWFAGGANPFSYYLVFMFVGTFVGALFSAILARRVDMKVERGKTASVRYRLLLALSGGVLVGFASRLASGCTSGQAMTGGSQLANGSLVFLGCVFISGYAVARFVRRQWND